MGKILLVISSARKTTIPSLSFNLYSALRKKHEVVVAILNSSEEDFYRFGKELRLDDTAEVSFFHKLISYFKKIRMVRKLKRDCMFDLTIGTDHSSIFVDFLSGGRAPKVGIFSPSALASCPRAYFF